MKKRECGKEVKGKETKDNQKCVIYIFAEGNTERIYLKHFENRTYNVQVVPVDTGHTDAEGIVKFAKNYINEHELDLELGDRGYFVFDSDPASNTKIGKAFDLIWGYKEKGLEVIFSYRLL